MIDDILTGLISGYVADRLARLVPPKATSRFDSMTYSELRARNHWIEMTGTVILVGSFLLIFTYLLAFGLNQNPWRLGLVFGLPITMAILFACAVTLPRGILRCREYWRYHEIKNKIRLALLFSLYIPFALLGVVSVFKSFS
jgi:hypothetical protein